MQHARWKESALTAAAAAWSLPAQSTAYLLPAVLEGIQGDATGNSSSYLPDELHHSSSHAIPLHYVLLVAILALLWSSPLHVTRLSSSLQASIFPSGHGAFLHIFEALDSLLHTSRLVCRTVAAHTYRPLLAIFRNERLYCQHKKRFYTPKQMLRKLPAATMSIMLFHLKHLLGLRAALAITAILPVYIFSILPQAKRGSAMRQDYGDLKTGLTYILTAALAFSSMPLGKVLMMGAGLAMVLAYETKLREKAWTTYLVSYCLRVQQEDRSLQV